MSRYLGVGPVHRGLIQACFDDGRLGVVRHDQMRAAADGFERRGVGADPVRQTLAPSGLGIGKAGRAHDGDEDLDGPSLAGQPVEHLHPVARVIDKQFLAAHMGGNRELAFPGAAEIAVPGIAIPIRVLGHIFVPQDRERDVPALQLPVYQGPVQIGILPMPPLLPGIAVYPGFQNRIRDLIAPRYPGIDGQGFLGISGRLYFGMGGDIISEWMGGFPRNQQIGRGLYR
jgi:hypothetical protein